MPNEDVRRLIGMPEDYSLFVKLPMFIPSSTAEVAAEVLVETVGSTGGQSTMFIALIINYMIGLSAYLVFGGINCLQLVSFVALFSIIVPPNSLPII